MKKLIALSFVLLAVSSMQAQRVVTLHGFLHVYPYDLGPFPSRPMTTIEALNRNNSYDFNDWRLPTREEMALIAQNQHIVSGISAVQYITSNGYSSGNVRLVSTGRRVSERRAEEEHERRRIEDELNRPYVTINGVRWARFNLNRPGSFVSSETDGGALFTWYEASNACPPGWRLPTEVELRRLLYANSVWATREGVTGRTFGTPPRQIFLPVTSRTRYGDEGSSIWSASTPRGAGVATVLTFSRRGNSEGRPNMFDNFSRGNRLSVRCVAE